MPQVASLKLELAALKSEQDIREDELLAQIASLQVGAGFDHYSCC